MSKRSTQFVCQKCGYVSPRWIGKCPECGEWNSLIEEPVPAKAAKHTEGRILGKAVPLQQVEPIFEKRMLSGLGELDRVLGGGLVPGSVVLMGGEPGIGKSTLLLDASLRWCQKGIPVLYVAGEESPQQIRLRADRMKVRMDDLLVLPETEVTILGEQIQRLRPLVVVVDSIQSVALADLEVSPGSLTQLRESTSYLVRLAKSSQVSFLLVGHVTKDGAIAGPKAIEHAVDTVLYLEGESHHSFRILRAVKNRFGSTNEIGVFEMREEGLTQVANPSGALLNERLTGCSGSVVVPLLEGTRPLLVEIQALVSYSAFGTPRRMAAGVDYNRFCVVLAVLEKRAGFNLGNQDVHVSVAGGMRVTEPAGDLGLALAVVSSFRDQPIKADLAVCGEVGLAGEVRAVGQEERRVQEAARLGFHQCLVPWHSHLGNQSRREKIEITRVKKLEDALAVAFEEGREHQTRESRIREGR